MTVLLAAERISFRYSPQRLALREVSLQVEAGEIVFVLGANGSGKTTLLDCLAGVRPPASGRILLGGDAAKGLAPSERARRVGLVPQLHEPVFDYTVEDVVMMGRAPYLGTFGRPSKGDRDAVAKALDAVGLTELRHRIYTAISGGERQLALVARGLAQGAKCLLMDEPAAHLDPRHQHGIFRVIRQLAAEGFGFVVSSHQPNSALLYAHRAAFLVEGRLDVAGEPREVVKPEMLLRAYGVAFAAIGDSGDGARAVLPRQAPDN